MDYTLLSLAIARGLFIGLTLFAGLTFGLRLVVMTGTRRKLGLAVLAVTAVGVWWVFAGASPERLQYDPGTGDLSKMSDDELLRRLNE